VTPAAPLGRNRPNFFIVGAPRCGTSSMYLYLKQHPEVFVSLLKEPHYLASDLTQVPHGVYDESLYLELFEAGSDRPRRGEGSVWYLSSPRAPHEIRAFSPDAKILIHLREPAAMAYSLHGLYLRAGNDDLESFEDALAAEPDRREGRRIPASAYFPEGLQYTEAARFAPKVERYLEVFGPENVHCVLFDDFVRDTAAEYRKALEFLGVDPEREAELDPKRATERVRMLAVRQIRDASPEVKRRLRLHEMKTHESPPRRPLAADVAERFRERLAADTLRLGELVGRDLGPWLRGERLAPVAPEAARGGGVRDVLASVRALRRIPPEVRAKHERAETLEQKFGRWQKLRSPEVPLTQRAYDPAWADWFARERDRIADALGCPASRIAHHGSSSVPGLSSKNVIDMAVALDPPVRFETVEERLVELGYEPWGNSPLDPETVWLWRIELDRAFAVHVCAVGRPWLSEVIDHRDFLRAHPEERERYAALKRRLAEEERRSYLEYTINKMTLWIEMAERARAWRERPDVDPDRVEPVEEEISS
jgi:GrpB-like predicted nucleotidyltransferase (UPF0157 family)